MWANQRYCSCCIAYVALNWRQCSILKWPVHAHYTLPNLCINTSPQKIEHSKTENVTNQLKHSSIWVVMWSREAAIQHSALPHTVWLLALTCYKSQINFFGSASIRNNQSPMQTYTAGVIKQSLLQLLLIFLLEWTFHKTCWVSPLPLSLLLIKSSPAM